MRELDAPLHPEDPAQGTRKLPFSRVRLRRSRRLPRGPAQGLVPAGAGARGAPALRLPGHAARGVVKDASGEVDRAARHLGSGVVGRQRARRAHGARHAALGVGGARGRPPRCGSTIACSPSRTRAPTRRRASSTRSTPIRSCGVEGAVTEPYLATAGEARHARAVRARRLLLPRPRQQARQADLEPHRRPQGQLGEDREQGGKAKAKAAATAKPEPEKATRSPRRPQTRPRRRPEIAIDDLGKVDLRVGLVKSAELVAGARQAAQADGRSRRRSACARSSPACAPTTPIRPCWSAARSWWSPTSSRGR